MDATRTPRRCTRGHIMKPHWVECEICGVKIDRTPRGLDMNPSPPGPTMVSLSVGAPSHEAAPVATIPNALAGVLVIPDRDEIHKLRVGDNAVGASEANDILIEGKFVSASHAVITWSPEEAFAVTDLNSTNGTFVNDRRVSNLKVKDGDRIRFGNIQTILKSIL